ncbi:MAG: glycosyltransferase [Clostridiales bacterium]|nr:glycosyltransferase [Clostridiales bacterium]
MNDLISVIIPVYNAERTIGRCLDSVLAQSHAGLEAICIVDGSRDGSADILYRYAERDPRVIVIEQESSGPATARNAGLDAASGSFVGFVDADDFIDNAMYERLLSAISGAELANCGHVSFFPDGTEKEVAPALKGVLEVSGAAGLGRLITGAPDFIWDKLYDARIIRENEIRFPDGRVYGEDTVFLAKYLGHVKTASFIDAPLYHYNAHSEGSITNTISDRWYDIFENLKEIIHYYREQLDDEGFAAVGPYLEELCIRYYDRRANAMIRYDERDFQIRYVKYSFEFLTLNFPGWRERMRGMEGVLFPRVKTSLFLMRLYIIAPGFLKRRYAERVAG